MSRHREGSLHYSSPKWSRGLRHFTNTDKLGSLEERMSAGSYHLPRPFRLGRNEESIGWTSNNEWIGQQCWNCWNQSIFRSNLWSARQVRTTLVRIIIMVTLNFTLVYYSTTNLSKHAIFVAKNWIWTSATCSTVAVLPLKLHYNVLWWESYKWQLFLLPDTSLWTPSQLSMWLKFSLGNWLLQNSPGPSSMSPPWQESWGSRIILHIVLQKERWIS